MEKKALRGKIKGYVLFRRVWFTVDICCLQDVEWAGEEFSAKVILLSNHEVRKVGKVQKRLLNIFFVELKASDQRVILSRANCKLDKITSL